MNIVYSSSEYYYEPTFVSIYSLLKNSKVKHVIVLLSSGVPEDKIKKLSTLIVEMGSEFKWYDISGKLNYLAKKFQLPLMRGGYSTYARIFLSEILSDLNDVLLIDSDTLVLGDVAEISSMNSDYVMLACRDYVVSNKYSEHEDCELSSKSYYNMGVLYVNLQMWRELRLTDILINNFDFNHTLKIADQTIINKYLHNFIGELHIKFNFYTYFHYGLKYVVYRKLNNKTMFAQEHEFNLAKSSPIILHFIGTWYERPWFKYNISPYKNIYRSYWGECFPGVPYFENPKLNVRNFIYDLSSLVIYKLFGIVLYFSYRYRLIQFLKKFQ